MRRLWRLSDRSMTIANPAIETKINSQIGQPAWITIECKTYLEGGVINLSTEVVDNYVRIFGNDGKRWVSLRCSKNEQFLGYM